MCGVVVVWLCVGEALDIGLYGKYPVAKDAIPVPEEFTIVQASVLTLLATLPYTLEK